MKNLIQISRSKIIQNRINLISKKELVEWADSIIRSLPEPPNYIIDLSVGEIPVIPEQLDTVRNPINLDDCFALLEEIKNKFKEEKTNINKIESICYQLALITEGEISNTLHWVSDEIHLCNDGYQDINTSIPNIEKALNEITA